MLSKRSLVVSFLVAATTLLFLSSHETYTSTKQIRREGDVYVESSQAGIPRIGRSSARFNSKGDVLVTFDSRHISDTPDGDFIFYAFLYNKILEAKGSVDHYRHFHGRKCVNRPDALEREDHETIMDPHWCRIHVIWQLLDEGFDRVLYVDTDLILVNDFTLDKFISETESITDFMGFQNVSEHKQHRRSLHGICIKEGGTIHITSGLLLFKNTGTSYQILKDWLATYQALSDSVRANDQGPLHETLRKYPNDVSLTCSRGRWLHYFNGLGEQVRAQTMRRDLARLFRDSLSDTRLVSPYGHLVVEQQDLRVHETLRAGRG